MKKIIPVLFILNFSPLAFAQPCGAPPIITFTYNTLHICEGESGTVSAAVVGGVGDITYNWFPFPGSSNTMTASPTVDSWCYLEITDDCHTVLDSMVFAVEPITLTSINTVSATNCPALTGTLGSIDVFPDDPSWTYSISGASYTAGPGTSNTFSNLPGGVTYWLHIQSSHGCELDTAVTVLLGSNNVTGVFNSAALEHELCYGDSIGVAEVLNINGGVTPPYTIYWNNADGIYDQTVVNVGAGDLINNLPGGGWVVSAVDQEGCAWSQYFVIEQPEPFGFDFDLTIPTCYAFTDGSLEVAVTGGAGGLQIDITNQSGAIMNMGGIAEANNLGGGWYFVEVTDNDGCVGIDSAFIDEPDQFEIFYTEVNPLCATDGDGAINVYDVENTHGNYLDLSYWWVPNPWGTNGVGTDTLENINGGEYTLTINDSWGCSETFDIFLWPDTLYFITLGSTVSTDGFDGSVYCTIGGGDSPYSYLWTSLDNFLTYPTATANNVTPGYYVIEVTDASGCILTDTVKVEMLHTSEDYINLISVSVLNGKNIQINSGSDEIFQIEIYDSKGSKVNVINVEKGINDYFVNIDNGIYMYSILDNEMNKIQTGKICLVD